MELKKTLSALPAQLKKFYPALIVLFIGLVLLLIPGKRSETTAKAQPEAPEKEVSTEEKLEIILSKIDGAGDVQVMLTAAAGQEYIYQTDQNSSDREGTQSIQITTVTVTDTNRNQSGLIRQVIPEKYQGAIVVCRGADRASVQLAIVKAVSNATGLGADHISVIKMK